MSRKVSKNSSDNHQIVDDELKTVTTINSFYSQTRFGDLFREFQRAKNKRKVVELLQLMAKHEKIGIDFDISLVYFLNLYFCCPGQITLIDAGFLVESAGRIYSRKVNALSDRVFEAVNGAAEEETQNDTSSPKKQRCPKRTWSPDKPYEADINPKHFKKLDLSKTTENLTESSTFEPPKQYFKNWKRYKEWRAIHLKKMKCPVPYSVVCDNSWLHPSMWNSSRIEDFDYEDDVDTKRNYKVFTNYMEHRYSTLVNDINFIMHFKMKDFIEMEEDEIDEMNLLGLPPPPKRQWPAYCTNVPTEDQLHGSLSYEETCEDYIKNYVALEDTVFHNNELNGFNFECNDFNSNLPGPEISLNLIENISVGGEASTSNNYSSVNSQENICSDVSQKQDSSANQPISDSIDKNISGDVQVTDKNVDMPPSQPPNEKLTNPDLPSDNISLENNSKQNPSELSSNQSGSQTIEITTINSLNAIASIDNITNENEHQISNKDLENVQADNLKPIENNPENVVESTKAVLINSQENVQDNSPSENIETINCAQLNINVEQPSVQIFNNLLETSPTETVNEKTVNSAETMSYDNIRVRLSVDEGVSFADLDEIDLAMLTPSVELIDIFGPLKKENINPEDLSVEVGTHIKNLFKIDDHSIDIEQTFELPINIITKRVEIEKNILKLPEVMLRKRRLFKLTEEFDIYINRSCKRKAGEILMETRKTKLLKLETFREDNNRTPDFLGFPESPKTNRTISRDSGICLPSDQLQGEDLPLTPEILPQNGQVLNESQSINLAGNSSNTQDKTLSPSSEGISENGQVSNEPQSINPTGNSSGTQDKILSPSEGTSENVSLPANNASINDLNVTSQDNTLSTSEIVYRNENLNADGLNESLSNLNQILNSTAPLSTSVIDSGNGPPPGDVSLNTSTLDESLSNPVLNSTVNQSNDSIGPTMSSGYHSSFNSSSEQSLSIEKDGTQNPTNSITDENQSIGSIHADNLTTTANEEQNNMSDLSSNSKQLRNEENAKEMNEMIEKIQLWHRSLKPILAKSKERHHFDVFAIGSEILNKFQSSNDSSSESVTLQSVMLDNDPSYVSRYFLSTLLLANHRNIELNVENYNCLEPTKLENIEIKLLTKKRYSISFEDDIGQHSRSKKRPHSPEFIVEESSQNPEPSILNISNEEPQLTMEKHEKEKEIMLQKYKESHKRILADEVNANRDNLLRFYSKKHDIDLRLYVPNEELQRISTGESTNNLDILGDFLFPEKIDVIQRCKKSKPCDETDSGFLSQSQISVSSAS